MRAFVPFSRYTRDCDFVIPKENGWAIDLISRWFPEEVKIEAFEKHETFGYLKVMDILRIQRKTARVSIDFMEGEVRGRTEEQVINIDQKFVENRKSVKLNVGGRDITMFVPDYVDFFILKMVSSRPSDVRDIAALVWKNGIPDNLDKRIREILPIPIVFGKMLKDNIIPDISDKRFVDSWRGTFVTTEFDEKAKEEVLLKIKGLDRIS